MKRLFVSLMLVAFMSLPTYAQSKQISLSEAKKQASEISDRFQAAFNKQDAEAVASLFAPDAVLVTPTGSKLEGAEAIKRFYVTFFQGPIKNLNHQIKVDEVHLLGPGGAWALGHSIFLTKADNKVVSKAHWTAIYRVHSGHLQPELLSVGTDVPPPAKAAQK